MSSAICEFCRHEIPLTSNYCPHCARPGLFPNVKMAQVPAEKEALSRRYQKARRKASSRGAEANVDEFEELAKNSKAIIAKPMRELDRIASSNQELFSTYYKLLGAEVRLPHGNQWDLLRSMADDYLFTGYKEEIRFAALSLDGLSLSNYGECSCVLKEDMIAHRASVFEGNSAVLLKGKNYKLPLGYRAPWGDRGRLCVAKLGSSLDSNTPVSQFPAILLCSGPTSEMDEFVEVHIWGPISLYTLERVFLMVKIKKAFQKALRDRLAHSGVILEEVS